jgi:hypothetical protein
MASLHVWATDHIVSQCLLDDPPVPVMTPHAPTDPAIFSMSMRHIYPPILVDDVFRGAAENF